MAEDPKNAAALSQLQKAMDASVELMDQEYYSMRLVIDAKGYTDYPEILNGVQLSSEDAALSAEDKMLLATKMVLNDDYYSQKKLIRLNMKDSLSELEALARSEENDALQQLYKGTDRGSCYEHYSDSGYSFYNCADFSPWHKTGTEGCR